MLSHCGYLKGANVPHNSCHFASIYNKYVRTTWHYENWSHIRNYICPQNSQHIFYHFPQHVHIFALYSHICAYKTDGMGEVFEKEQKNKTQKFDSIRKSVCVCGSVWLKHERISVFVCVENTIANISFRCVHICLTIKTQCFWEIPKT